MCHLLFAVRQREGYMSQQSLQTKECIETHNQKSNLDTQNVPTHGLSMFWWLRIFFAIAFTGLYSICLLAGIIGFFLTKNPYCLTTVSLTVFMPLVYYLVPMDERRFHLKLARIQAKAWVQIAKQETKRQRVATKQSEKEQKAVMKQSKKKPSQTLSQ